MLLNKVPINKILFYSVFFKRGEMHLGVLNQKHYKR